MPNEMPEHHEESRHIGENGTEAGPGAVAHGDVGAGAAGPRRLGQRILVGVAVGLTIFAITVVAAWLSSQGTTWADHGQGVTGLILTKLNYSIEEFVKKHKRCPVSLAELGAFEGAHIRLDQDSNVLDGWGRPLMYSVEGGKCRVLSYGRDGKPGGVGLNQDLSSDGPRPSGARMTLGQFLFEMPSGEMIRVCAITGFCAFLLSFMVIKPASFGLTQLVEMVVKTGFIALAAVIVSVAVISLHYLSGH